MNRGEIYDIDFPASGRRPGVIVTRQVAIPLLANVTAVEVTSRVRGVPTEVALDEASGVAAESVVNCDNVATVAKRACVRYRGRLGPDGLRRVDDALRIALELD